MLGPRTRSLVLRREDYSPESSWRLLDWCMARGADELGLTFLGAPYLPGTAWAEVDELLAPFRRRIASAGDRWALTGESASVLRSLFPAGLLNAHPGERQGDAWLEDPTIYRGGAALLTVVTHEGVGILHLSTDDAEHFERTGLPFERHPHHL